ncbi:bifunctional diguanylate cyclase/phosphodiesterase [Alteromonas sp. KUL49]|nr:bifunctional diguanylate cyclase/phosphodiesterase [Alteromonas sp. KUL49]
MLLINLFPLLSRISSAISHAEYCVVVNGHNGMPIESIDENSDINKHYTGNSEDVFDETVLKHWLTNHYIPNKPVLFNDSIPDSYQRLVKHNKAITSISMIPITVSSHIYGVIVLASVESKIEASAVSRLSPVLGSSVMALKAAQSVKGHNECISEKIASNHFLDSLLATSPVCVVVVDAKNTIVFANDAANKTFVGLSLDAEQEMTGSQIDLFLPNYNSLFNWRRTNRRAPRDNDESTLGFLEEQSAIKQSGVEFIVNIHVFRHSFGENLYTTLQISDITEQRAGLEQFRETSQQLNALTHLVPVGIIRVDDQWKCQFANDKWLELSGQSAEEASMTGWLDAFHSDDIQHVLEKLRASLIVGENFCSEVRLVNPYGNVRWAEMNTQVLYSDNGNLQGFIGTFADITERLVYQEKLKHTAEYDSLTGLANRELFTKRLDQALLASNRGDFSVYVMYLDLDGFKDINDTYGHSTGDVLLQKVSDRLINTLRQTDTIARFGGDEFVVLLGRNTRDDAHIIVAENLVRELARPFRIEENQLNVTCSVGISMGIGGVATAEVLLKQADAALYLAKGEGKNKYRMFSEELNEQAKHRMYASAKIRSAIQHDGFFLVFQPQASIANNTLVGFEVLLRLNDKETSISPQECINILEDTGQMISVGQWIVKESIKQMSVWLKSKLMPENGFISINISAKQLLDSHLTSLIFDCCKDNNISPERVVLELTETTLIDKPKSALRTMKQLKSMGVRFALDDFGTGYSSLTYLQRYPIDHIKIDKSFISDLLTDDNNAKITQSIVTLAQSLALKITAEGVEDAATLSVLDKMKVDYFQGYYLSKPITADEVNNVYPAKQTSNVLPIRRRLKK